MERGRERKKRERDEDMTLSQRGNLASLLFESRQRKREVEAAVELSQDSVFMRYALDHMRSCLAPGAVIAVPSLLFAQAAQHLF